MRFAILGSLEVNTPSGPVPLGAPKPRAVLAMLLVARGAVVSVEKLFEDLWDGRPPKSAATTLQTYVSGLRKALGHDVIQLMGNGYRIALAEHEVDAERFEAGLAAATAHTIATEARAVQLEDALALWHGPALGEFADASWAAPEAARLEELRRTATELLIDARLELGHHATLIADLEVLVDEYPLRERFWAQLMLALYRSGRQADALRTYVRLRSTLAEELGITPGRQLVDLEAAMVRQEPQLDWVPFQTSAPPRAPSTGEVPSPATALLTLMFTDIENSTATWEVDTDAMSSAVAQHDALLGEIVARHQGMVFKSLGDGFGASFDDPVCAVNAAIEIQRAVLAASWPTATPLRVRIGLHTGLCELRGDDYFGPTVNAAARLANLGHGGQTICSAVTAELVERRVPTDLSLTALGQHRLKGIDRVAHVYQLTVAGMQTQFPPLRSGADPGRRSNLPAPRTTFIGRERELDTVAVLVDAGARLITVVGPGGVGKTALALQVAPRLAERFTDGVWLVELAPVAEADDVVASVGRTLGIRDDPSRDQLDHLVDAVASRNALLILDNCEHVIDAAAKLVDQLTQRCSHLVVLATSREPLLVRGEQVRRLKTLTVPNATDHELDVIVGTEAVQLFIDRAHAQQPEFHMTADDAPLVATICRRLDGIPLAIELAAARLESMTIAAVADRLDKRFTLLTRGARVEMPRHQTLRSLVDWSWDLLDPTEQMALARLSVFAGGITPEAAESVMGLTDLVDAELMLASLASKSLIQQLPDGRYALLETIRSYAHERLAAFPDDTLVDTQRAHRTFYLELAGWAGDELEGPRQKDVLQLLRREHNNFIAAVRSCVANSDTCSGVEIIAALAFYWRTCGKAGEAVSDLLRLLKCNDPVAMDPVLTARAYSTASYLLNNVDEYAQAEEFGRRAVQTADSLDHEQLQSEAYLRLGTAEYWNGGGERAELHLKRGLSIARRSNEARLIALHCSMLAVTYKETGNHDAAAQLWHEALDIWRAFRNELRMAGVLANLGDLRLSLGDVESAHAHFTEAHEINVAMGGDAAAAVSWFNIGLVDLDAGRTDSARDSFLRGTELARRVGDRQMTAVGALGLAVSLSRTGHDEAAAELHGCSQQLLDGLAARLFDNERRLRDTDRGELQQRLGLERFTCLIATGRQLTVDAALALAEECTGRA